MTLRTGFFRLWVVLAVLWVLYVLAYAFGSWSDAPLGDRNQLLALELAGAVVVPLFALALGRATFWIAAGFRKRA